MKNIIVKGLASNNTVSTLTISPINNEKTLLEILQEAKIPIASSCNGHGQCAKCVITINNKTILSCQLTCKDLKASSIVEVSYL